MINKIHGFTAKMHMYIYKTGTKAGKEIKTL
jgi:hypothetical protein